ncbi:hypothetical protein [Pseudokordiimonas caeni]|uniref:hypothetical protein n=1 Tax=Pseudokordiimonas caeni TaxID=2997908 RepID=UPI0028123F99|nr:hypothetical protein [Pseudokordiimonas caeni]
MQRHFLILPLAFAGAACSVSYEARVEAFNDRQQKQFDECIGPAPDALAEFSGSLTACGKCSFSSRRTRSADGKSCEMTLFRTDPWEGATLEECDQQFREWKRWQG